MLKLIQVHACKTDEENAYGCAIQQATKSRPQAAFWSLAQLAQAICKALMTMLNLQPACMPSRGQARAWRALTVLTVGLLLGSCGGGGSNSGASAATPTATDPEPVLIDFPIAKRASLYLPVGNKRLLFMGQDMVALGGLVDGAITYRDGYLDDADLRGLPVGLTTYLQVTDNQGLTSTFHNSGEEKNAELTVNHPAFKDGGSKPLLAIGYYLDNNYDQVLNGGRDANLKALADWIKAKNLPVFLRIGYEFNGSWTGHPKNKSGFINAYRYIASKLQHYGATQVSFVWQSDGQGSEAELAAFYPGDAYVDWVGYTHFDLQGEGLLALAKTHNKPVMISEASPLRFNLAKAGDADGKAAWDAWFQPLLDHMKAHPEIRALAYINDNWPAKAMWVNIAQFNTADTRIQRSPYVKAKWISEMNNGTWVTRAEALNAVGFTP
jgi:Glycosyl hydrolase family 26